MGSKHSAPPTPPRDGLGPIARFYFELLSETCASASIAPVAGDDHQSGIPYMGQLLMMMHDRGLSHHLTHSIAWLAELELGTRKHAEARQMAIAATSTREEADELALWICMLAMYCPHGTTEFYLLLKLLRTSEKHTNARATAFLIFNLDPEMQASLVERAILALNQLRALISAMVDPWLNRLKALMSSFREADAPRTPEEVVPFQETERKAILAAIDACYGRVKLAAEKLKLGRATVYRKLKKYGGR